MPQTRPTGDQLRFQSSKTGEHVLDDYMEAVERGTRTLPNLLDDLWAPGDGALRSDLWDLRVNPTNSELEQRVGDFPNANTGWTPVANASFFNFRGAYATATAYLRLDLVTYMGDFYLCTAPHTSSGAAPSGTNFKPLVTLAAAGVNTFNGRSGAVLLTSGDVTSALSYTPTSPATLASTVSPLAPINSPTFTGTVSLPASSIIRKQSDVNGEGGELIFERSATGLTGGNVFLDLQGGAIRFFDNNGGTPVRRFEFNLVTGDIWNSTKNANVSYVGHTHAISDITNLQTTLNGKSNTDHTHTYLPLTGGTITGNLSIIKSAPTLTLDGANPTIQVKGSNTSTNSVVEFWGNMGGASALQAYIITNANNPFIGYAAEGHTFFNLNGSAQLASISTSGLVVLGRNVLNEIDGKAPTSHTHAISNITGLQATLDTKANTTGNEFTGPTSVVSGGNVVTLSTDGAIEITRSGGSPYIDLKDSTSEDFDVRISASGTALHIGASDLRVGGTQVSLVGHTHSIANITGLQSALDGKLNTSGGTIFGGLSVATDISNNGNIVTGGTVVIFNGSPTQWWQDTDNRSFAIHVNANFAYFMRGGVNTTTWTTLANGQWPMMLSLETGDLTVGNNLTVMASISAAGNVSAQGAVFTPRVSLGNDAEIRDMDVANTVFIHGQQNTDRGYINFSNTSNNALGAINGGNLTWRGATVWHSSNFDPNSKLNAANPSASGNLTVGGSVTAEGIELGYRSLPLVNNLASGITASISMRGKGYYASQPITVPANVFAKEDMFTIVSTSSGTVSVVQGSGLTLRLAGTPLTGNRTLAASGIATILFVSATEAYISGPGVS